MFTTLAVWLLACTPEGSPTPYGLFMANGMFDPIDPTYTSPTFEQFFIDQLGGTDADVERAREEAKAFFLDAYGVDVDARVADGRLQWLEFRVDPRGDYRVYALPDRAVAPEGWPIEEIAFSAIVIDPAGLELGGPYAGATVGPGPLGAFGYYQVDALDAAGAFDESIVIAYQTDGVMATSLDGRSLLYCRMDSEQLGQGLGHITSEIRQTEDGLLQYDFTNVQRWDDYPLR